LLGSCEKKNLQTAPSTDPCRKRGNKTPPIRGKTKRYPLVLLWFFGEAEIHKTTTTPALQQKKGVDKRKKRMTKRPTQKANNQHEEGSKLKHALLGSARIGNKQKLSDCFIKKRIKVVRVRAGLRPPKKKEPPGLLLKDGEDPQTDIRKKKGESRERRVCCPANRQGEEC